MKTGGERAGLEWDRMDRMARMKAIRPAAAFPIL
jgi:hypothetical protein